MIFFYSWEVIICFLGGDEDEKESSEPSDGLLHAVFSVPGGRGSVENRSLHEEIGEDALRQKGIVLVKDTDVHHRQHGTGFDQSCPGL